MSLCLYKKDIRTFILSQLEFKGIDNTSQDKYQWGVILVN